MTLLSQLTKDQIETQLTQALDVKEGGILHKYLTAIGNQIVAGDECKSFSRLSWY